jgi:hypothetical protein
MDLDELIARWKAEGLITQEQASKLVASSRGRTMPGHMGLFAIAGAANGLALYLFAFLYDVPLAAHVTLLLWLLSLLPLLYLARSRVLAGLLGLVFVCWLPLFALREVGVVVFAGTSVMPIVFLLGGTLLFGFGGLHYLVPALAGVARGLRIVGLLTVTLALFVLGLTFWSGRSGGPMIPFTGGSLWSSVLVLGAGAGILALAGMVARRRAPMITGLEGPISLGLTAVGLLYFLLPLPAVVFVVGFNVLAAAMLGLLLVTGWSRADLRLVDIANVGLLAMLLTRWLDLGWGRLSAQVLFGGGAALALALGALLAWKRQRVLLAARRAVEARRPGVSAHSPSG